MHKYRGIEQGNQEADICGQYIELWLSEGYNNSEGDAQLWRE